MNPQATHALTDAPGGLILTSDDQELVAILLSCQGAYESELLATGLSEQQRRLVAELRVARDQLWAFLHLDQVYADE